MRESRRPLTAEGLASLVVEDGALAALGVVAASPSTNLELLAALEADPAAWPHMSALVADHQTAGRGRAGRSWMTPAGAALTVSFVVRPGLPDASWGLVPLAVGLATVRTLRAGGIDARLKWPNDVVVAVPDAEVPGWGRYRKVAGILCERRDDAVVAGVGINVSQATAELPVPHAASLLTLGSADLDRSALLGALAAQLAAAVAEAEADANSLVKAVTDVTATLGTAVVVEREGQPPLTGEAVALAPSGALLVRTGDGATHEIHAGDVRLRRVT